MVDLQNLQVELLYHQNWQLKLELDLKLQNLKRYLESNFRKLMIHPLNQVQIVHLLENL